MNEKNDFIAFVCPHCQQEIESPRDLAGQKAECPSCGGMVMVPSASEAPTPAQLEAMKSRTIRIELPDL